MGADREDESWKEICGCRQSQGLYLRCGRDGDQERPEEYRDVLPRHQEVVTPPLQPPQPLGLDFCRSY